MFIVDARKSILPVYNIVLFHLNNMCDLEKYQFLIIVV